MLVIDELFQKAPQNVQQYLVEVRGDYTQSARICKSNSIWTKMSNEFHEHDYYTTTELAEQLGVNKSTIALWRISGRIPASAVTKFRNTFYFRCDIIRRT